MLNEKGDEQQDPDEAGSRGRSHQGAGGSVGRRAGSGHAQNQAQAQDHNRRKQRIDRVVVGLLHVPETERQQHRGDGGRQSSPEGARDQEQNPDAGDGEGGADRPGQDVGFPESAVAFR